MDDELNEQQTAEETAAFSDFPAALAIDAEDAVVGLKSGSNTRFLFSVILAWLQQIFNSLFIPTSQKGANGGVATLNASGQVPGFQLDLSGKQNKITASGVLKGNGSGGVTEAQEGTDYGTYSKPSGGIPSTDMASAVQTSLGKADTAYQKPSGGIPASDLANGVIPSVPSPSDATPQDLGTPAAGSSGNYSRADHTHKLPSAADVGALAEDGTALNAETLSVSHTISGGAGWYKFFEETISVGLSRGYDFLITNTYNLQSGILRVFINRTSNVTTVKPHFLSGTIPADTVRWEYSDKLILYIYKPSDSNGYLQFRVLSNSARTGNPLNLSIRWKNEAVSEPAGAAYATADILQFTAQAISAGTNQQILSISNTSITEDHVLARIEFADPKYITAAGSWATAARSFTLTGTATAATTANVLLIRKGN